MNDHDNLRQRSARPRRSVASVASATAAVRDGSHAGFASGTMPVAAVLTETVIVEKRVRALIEFT